MSKQEKKQEPVTTRLSLDHDRVRAEFPIGTKLGFGKNTIAVIIGWEAFDTTDGRCLWVNIKNVKTQDWFSADPYFWGIQDAILK